MEVDFGSQNVPQIGPKSIPNRFQRGFERALNEDVVSDLEKESARFTGRAPAEIKMEDFRSMGEGNREGGQQLAPHA